MAYRIRALLFVMLLGWSLTTAPSAAADQPFWVAFGDSITVGIGASTPSLSYIGRLQAVLGPIQNNAISATTIDQHITHIHEYTGTATHVLWLTGYNDMRAGTALPTYQQLLNQALHELTTAGKTVYIGLCLPMTSAGYQAYGPQWNHGSTARVQAINQIIRETAAAYENVHLVPISMYQPEYDVTADLVHPNDQGHQHIADAFLAQLSRQIWLPVVTQTQSLSMPPNIPMQHSR